MPLVMLALVFLLQGKPIISQVQSPSKNHQTASTDKHESAHKQKYSSAQTSPPPTTYNVTNGDKPESDPDKMEERRDRKAQLRLNRIYVYATVVGVIGSWVVLGVLIWQNILTRRSANAALLNAQVAIAATRPYVSISGFYNSGVCMFKAINYGNTPAEIISYSANMKFVDKIENLAVPPEYDNWREPSLALLSPGGTGGEAMLDLETYDTNSIIAPNLKPIFVFYFSIRYKNPIGSDNQSITNHESRMCFWYHSRGGQFPRVGGPQEYNKHT